MSDSHACTDWRPEDWWLFRRLNAGTREQRVDLQQGQSVDARTAQRAAEHVNDVITQGGAEAVALITELLQSAADTDALVLVGSGPLENLLHEHGAAVVEEVEHLARQEPAFTEALRWVWLEHRAPPAGRGGPPGALGSRDWPAVTPPSAHRQINAVRWRAPRGIHSAVWGYVLPRRCGTSGGRGIGRPLR